MEFLKLLPEDDPDASPDWNEVWTQKVSGRRVSLLHHPAFDHSRRTGLARSAGSARPAATKPTGRPRLELVQPAAEEYYIRDRFLPLKTVYQRPEHAHLGELFSYWRSIRYADNGRLPSIDDINSLQLQAIAPEHYHCYMFNQGSFLTVHYGGAAMGQGNNLTGRYVAEYPAKVYADFLQESYTQTRLLGSPRYDHVTARFKGPMGLEERDYYRLIMPLAGGGRFRFIVGVAH